MFISKEIRFFRRWSNRLFYLLFSLLIMLLFLISLQHNFYIDLTQSNKNTLNNQTLAVLSSLNDPIFEKIVISSYTSSVKVREKIRALLRRYQMVQEKIELEFIDPIQDPQLIKSLGIRVDGELIIELLQSKNSTSLLAKKKKHLTVLSEQALTTAILQLINDNQHTSFFISGHGERSILRTANFDMTDFATFLKRQGISAVETRIDTLTEKINTGDTIVLAGPQSNFSPEEVDSLIDLLKAGYHFLWLAEPINTDFLSDGRLGLKKLSKYLEIDFSKGVIVDPATQKLAGKRPDFAIVSEYDDHAITQQLKQTTLFPQATSILNLNVKKPLFEHQGFISSSDQTWLEKSPIFGRVNFDDLEDEAGPLVIGVSLLRNIIIKEKTAQQHIVVMGDGDFLSNAYLANGGNLALGLNIINWLNQQQKILLLEEPQILDKSLYYSEKQLAIIGIIFLFIIPFILSLIAFAIIHKRRNEGNR